MGFKIEGAQIVDASTARHSSPTITAPMPTPRPEFPATATTETMELRHRGFEITIRSIDGRYGRQSYGYTTLHRGHVLHETGGEFGSASAADKAARLLIDDALRMFDHSLAYLEEDEA